MSSTTRPVRTGLDAYYTPDPVARACVDTLGNLRKLQVWEPHAGGGAFVRALHRAGAVVTASDIDPNAAGLCGAPCSFVGDFLTYALADSPRPSWVVGNPPFSDAEVHVRHALAHATIGVGFLLRLAFLESAKRAPLWKEHPPAVVHVLTQRPSFTGGATDSAAYGWFVWQRGYRGGPHLDWINVEGR